MPTTGPWMDDAAVVEQVVAFADSANGFATTWGWSADHSTSEVGVQAAELAHVWNLENITAGPQSGLTNAQLSTRDNIAGSPASVASWLMMWVTLQKPTAPTVTSSTPPTGWDSDPNVIGVEWEPTTTVIDQRLLVRTPPNIAEGAYTVPFHVKVRDEVGAAYQPAAQTAATIGAMPDAGTFSLVQQGVEYGGSVSIPSPPIAVSPGGSFAVGLVDGYTNAQDAAGAAHLYTITDSDYSTQVTLYYLQRPRYRLLYADVPVSAVAPTRVTPSLRMLQRGGAGGMAGIPRMIGNPTRRGSVRQGPGSIY